MGDIMPQGIGGGQCPALLMPPRVPCSEREEGGVCNQKGCVVVYQKWPESVFVEYIPFFTHYKVWV